MTVVIIGCLRIFVFCAGLAAMAAVGMACGWLFGKIWRMVWREN